jgi:hypothetical protein
MPRERRGKGPADGLVDVALVELVLLDKQRASFVVGGDPGYTLHRPAMASDAWGSTELLGIDLDALQSEFSRKPSSSAEQVRSLMKELGLENDLVARSSDFDVLALRGPKHNNSTIILQGVMGNTERRLQQRPGSVLHAGLPDRCVDLVVAEPLFVEPVHDDGLRHVVERVAIRRTSLINR